MEPTSTFWFPAKSHGWGWGAPRRWQGWLVLLVYTAWLLLPLVLFAEQRAITVAALVTGTPVLLWVCLKKGEPARWRWGNR